MGQQVRAAEIQIEVGGQEFVWLPMQHAARWVRREEIVSFPDTIEPDLASITGFLHGFAWGHQTGLEAGAGSR